MRDWGSCINDFPFNLNYLKHSNQRIQAFVKNLILILKN